MSILPVNKLRCLSLGFPMLDGVFPGFEFGDFAVLQGNAASFMSSVLSVRAQLLCEYGGLESSTIFVDGGNSFSSYEVAETARDYSLDCKAVLEKVYVSRAFTAFQFSSLVLEKLCSALKKTKSRLLIVSDITALFLDRDMPKTDGTELFVKVCSKLSEIVSEMQVITVCSYFPRGRRVQGLFFEAALFGKCNVLIQVRKRGQIVKVVLEDHPHVRPFSMDFRADRSSDCVGGVSFGKNRSFV